MCLARKDVPGSLASGGKKKRKISHDSVFCKGNKLFWNLYGLVIDGRWD